MSPNASLLDAMKVISRNGTQVSLVVDENQILLGTLSDGDIRRALVSGKGLESDCSDAMNPDYRYFSQNIGYDTMQERMKRSHIRQMPVLDSQRKVIDCVFLDEFSPEQKENPVVIMAGGEGKRLRPYTQNCPKPMLLVGNKPILEILLEKFIASGFTQFYFSVNYLKEKIIDYFQDGSRWDVDINYLIEDKPLGTAGSLHMLPKDLTKPMLVLNGDVLTRLDPLNLLQFHLDHDASATICVREQLIDIPYGVVQSDGIQMVGFEEKPTYRYFVNAGVYVINPDLLSLLKTGERVDMPTFLEAIKNSQKSVAVCPIHEYWLDIGRPETFNEAHVTWENIG